jgi:O-antigen/teichoic acid export membrane protein
MGPRSSNVRAKIAAGIRWKLTSQLVSQLLSVAVTVVLARQLLPHDYGLAGMALVFSAIAAIMADFGFGAAVVQRRELLERDRSSAFWATVAIGIVCTLLLLALAGPIASFYDEPRVRLFVIALSFRFLILSLGATQSALLTRAMNFRSLELASMSGTVVGAVLAIPTAVAGYGPWALVVQQLGAGSATVLLLWLSSTWRPSRVVSATSIRSMWRFAASMLTTRVLVYLQRNVDNLLVGRFLGASPLGFYAMAYNLAVLPSTRLLDPIRAVLFPAFVRLQGESARVSDAWVRATRLLAALLLPVLLGLLVVAPDLVPAVLGDRWRPVVPVLQLLLCAGVLNTVATVNALVLAAIDRTGVLLGWSTVTFVLSVTAFGVGLHWGIKGVATGYLLANLLVTPAFTRITAGILGTSALRLASAVAPVGALGLVMAGVVWGTRSGLTALDVPTAARLAAEIGVGCVLYPLLCRLWAPDVLREAARLRPSRPAASTTSAPA